MSKKIFNTLLILFAGLSSIPVLSQSVDVIDFDWKDFDVAAKEGFVSEQEVDGTILFEKITLDIRSGNEDIVEYYLFTTTIHINNDNGIERNNRIYLPINYTGRFLKTKARVTNSLGEQIVLSERDIKEAVDEQTKVSYRYFALEGLDVGSFIEYFYLIERPAELSGRRIRVQGDLDILDYHFKLITDEHLDFSFKSFNTDIEFQEDSSFVGNRASWDFKMNDVKHFEEEEQAANSANKIAFSYKLQRNKTAGGSLYTYSNAAKFIGRASYLPDDKAFKKPKSKFIKSLAVNKKLSVEEKVRAIENHIKANYSYNKYGDPSLGDFSNIIEKKIANQYGYLKLFTTAFEAFDVEHEIVITTDRFEVPFDRDFEGYNYLDKMLIYIADLDKYLAPHEPNLRLGYIPAKYNNNYGLFISKVVIGDYATAIGEVKYIDDLPCETTSSQLDIKVDFNEEDIYESMIDFQATKTGFYTSDLRYYYNQLPVDKRKEILEDQLGYYAKEEKILSSGVENETIDLLGVKPLIMKSTYGAEAFIEQAGPKYIFKIGELIGAQMEMYNDVKERRQDIDALFARKYVRNITLNIPESYKISNLDEINIDKSYREKGKDLMVFKSSYSLEENKLVVRIDEYYTQTVYDAALFKEYKEVINAAADFNKVVVYLDRK